MKLAIEAQGTKITTVEGLGSTANSPKCNRPLWKRTPLMCGYCTPGFVDERDALLETEPAPDRRGGRVACSGNLCGAATQTPAVLTAALKVPASRSRTRRSHPPCLVWPEKTLRDRPENAGADGPRKVTGAANIPRTSARRLLYGMIYRSHWPAALSPAINIEKAKQVPGITAVVVETPGRSDPSRFYGEELAAFRHIPTGRLDALRVIEVEATPLPFVVKEEISKKPDSPRVWPNVPNLAEANVKRRRRRQAFANAAGRRGRFIHHASAAHQPLETHGIRFSVTPDHVTCWLRPRRHV